VKKKGKDKWAFSGFGKAARSWNGNGAACKKAESWRETKLWRRTV
jgi:hypothetical protein